MSAGARSTVVVVTWQGRGLVGRCLDALAAQTRPCRVLVVDNASEDGTAEELARHPLRPATLRLARNAGYAGGLAAALPEVDTPFVAWLNDDAEPEPGWLAALEDALDAGDPAGPPGGPAGSGGGPGAGGGPGPVAAAASVLCDGTGAPTSTGVRITCDGYGQDSTSAAPFGFCGGAALLRTEALREVGGVAGGLFCYYEDTDAAWRLRLAGYRVVAVPGARVRHLGGATARHGSARFHRWNERNRLLVLLRCAPAPVALAQLARFAALTLVLPWRADRPSAPNFATGLRLRVLGEVTARLPATLVARRRIGRRAVLTRAAVWSVWAGSA